MNTGLVERSAPESAAEIRSLDTGKGSIVHRMFPCHCNDGETVAASVVCYWAPYAVAVLGTLLPLSIVVLFTTSEAGSTDGGRVPFYLDFNTLFMFGVSFPLVLAFTVSDRRLVPAALSEIISDGILKISLDAASHIRERWESLFKRVNQVSYALGVIVAGIVAAANYQVYSDPGLKFWTADSRGMTYAGWMYLLSLFLAYSILPLFILRSIAVTRLLRSIIRAGEIDIVPFHPDRCGGLKPVGQIGLRSQYVLTVLGVNLLLLILVAVMFLEAAPPGLWALIIAAAITYFILGPIVFVLPLLPFRSGMLRAKNALMDDVAQRLRIELAKTSVALRNGSVTKEDEEMLDRLRKIGRLIEELPVWPFDATTLKKFITAYILPILGLIAYPAVGALIEFAAQNFG